jgi:hypothetical protein
MRGSIAIVASIVNSGPANCRDALARAKMKASSLRDVRNNRANAPFPLHVQLIDGGISITNFKTLGAICLAVSLAAASPALARGGHFGGGFHGGGFHGGGAHFADGGFRGGGYRGGGVGPGIAAGLIAGAVLGGAYGYYDAPYYYGDSYGYYDNGPYDYSDGANAFH